MTINDTQDEIIAEFSDFDDWMDRYQLLIDLGSEQQPLDERYKTDQNLIEGCQSRVWLQADDVDGRLVFQAESDALIVKGIVALLIRVLSGHTPDEILSADLYFIDRIGLREHLSPTRSNGLRRGNDQARECSGVQSRILTPTYIKYASPMHNINTAPHCALTTSEANPISKGKTAPPTNPITMSPETSLRASGRCNKA